MPVAPVEEIVTNKTLIQDCLTQISANNTPLALTIKDSAESTIYLSRIQSVDPAGEQIVLKQVLPSDWREKISPDSELEIKSHMNMGNIRFNGSMSTLDETADSPYCKLTFPTKIFRIQLRDYYRVSLAKIHSKVSLQTEEDTTLHGKCRDISMSGAMLALPRDSARLEVGQRIEKCELSIDEILDLNFEGEVRSLHEAGSEVLAGMQFLGLSRAQLKPISAALNKIERKNIQA